MMKGTAMQSWTNLQARRGSVAPFRAATRPTRQQLSNYRCRAAAAAVPDEVEVVVVGAGIAGLSAAVKLSKQGINPLVLESSDGVSPLCTAADAAVVWSVVGRAEFLCRTQVGGRVRTDVVDGFILDRGFQIFLTGYPEAQALLDYGALDLQPFYAGALVWTGSSFERVADPIRQAACCCSSGVQVVHRPAADVGLLSTASGVVKAHLHCQLMQWRLPALAPAIQSAQGTAAHDAAGVWHRRRRWTGVHSSLLTPARLRPSTAMQSGWQCIITSQPLQC
jgi:hypothetical protein